MDDCSAPLPTAARHGLELFNRGEYFEAHEALEDAWRAEKGEIRSLYQGILQAAVMYLHITRNNYGGAIKMFNRCMKLLAPWPDSCRGIDVGRLRRDLSTVMEAVTRLGPGRLEHFDTSLFRPVRYE
jgi:predicted metal-dependent hydrolase